MDPEQNLCGFALPVAARRNQAPSFGMILAPRLRCGDSIQGASSGKLTLNTLRVLATRVIVHSLQLHPGGR